MVPEEDIDTECSIVPLKFHHTSESISPVVCEGEERSEGRMTGILLL